MCFLFTRVPKLSKIRNKWSNSWLSGRLQTLRCLISKLCCKFSWLYTQPEMNVYHISLPKTKQNKQKKTQPVTNSIKHNYRSYWQVLYFSEFFILIENKNFIKKLKKSKTTTNHFSCFSCYFPNIHSLST